MIFYFAYGSNMNPARMTRRVGEFTILGRGVLIDYQFVFNKIARDKIGDGYANVMTSAGDLVEGVIYQFDEIRKLDKPEGYPIHYDRKLMTISIDGGFVEAWVYFARTSRISEGLKPSKSYLEHILLGKEYLSEAYFQKLVEIYKYGSLIS